MKKGRIDFLDGLRGIAILMVVLYHAYARWPGLVPNNGGLSSFPLFKFGYLGVQLFFLISGFVILMSLDKNSKFSTFIFKRWLRLFPAMLIATVLIFATGPLFPERPAGIPQPSDVISGLLFIDTAWIKQVTGFQLYPIENAFWSVIVEVKFYFVIGILYYTMDRSKAVIWLIALYAVSVCAELSHNRYLTFLSDGLSLKYYGWFASGCLAYLFYNNRQWKFLLPALIIAVFEIIYRSNELYRYIIAFAILAAFMLPVYFEQLRGLFANRFLLFVGFISYPLYLIHENDMIAIIIKLHNHFAFIPGALLPLISISILCFIAWLIAKYAEPFVKNLIHK